MKLLGYYDITAEAWILIISGFLSFLCGILTVFIARDTFGKSNDINIIINQKPEGTISFANDGKYLRNATLFLSMVGLFAAFQRWMVLMGMFGSIPKVLLNANLIYRMRIENEIPGFLPYIFVASYSAVFLGAVYTAYKSKFSIIGILPLIGVVITEIANVGRAGILLAFFEFTITLILFRFIASKFTLNKLKKSKKNFILYIVIAVALFIGSITLVRATRGTIESYQSASRQLNKMRTGVLITPSLYMYSSSHIVVFSRYLEADKERKMFGTNTFMPIYSLMAKFGLVEQPSSYDVGYSTPIWSNTGTYLRDLHADFGIWGVFIVPFLVGILCTYYWFKFYEGNRLVYLAILVYLYLFVAFSFLNIVSRLSIWLLSLILLIVVIEFTQRIVHKKFINVNKKINYII